MNDDASGISHKLLLEFLYPYNTTFIIFITFNIFLSKRTLQLSLQSYLREIRDELFNFRTTIVSFALVDNSCDSYCWQEFDRVIIAAFGNIM